MSVSIMIIQ